MRRLTRHFIRIIPMGSHSRYIAKRLNPMCLFGVGVLWEYSEYDGPVPNVVKTPRYMGWCNERLVPMPYTEGGRIILVLDGDPCVYKNKVYLFISSRRIAGCLIAEPIKQAFKLPSRSEDWGFDGTSIKRIESHKSATLQFGAISLKREVNKKAHSLACSEVLDGNLNGAIIYEREAVPAVCGIRAIWVTPSNRRKHIASQLVDAVRKSFCMGFVLERSQPTSAGKTLAVGYFGTRSFLVYKTNNLES
ncbi:protein CHROMOSOME TRANSMISSION FIDELITY 7-like isoform X2 [Carya illinoinensis]|uniref:protein CHROMOSOME TRANSMISSION FIDELITY 7-like isoform X2 n=1 Tax=Carya illinoinensis TaxID=32201 RepID=UPI001C719919|nr:protein CHROMOSOME TRANSMISSION FIDELITY 7-like isoform X2 [Carya illinoinensis]